MTGLVLNLKPYEKFLVGSVVMQNGSRRTQIRVIDGVAGVLRVDDALHPDDVTTPLTRAYFAIQAQIVEPHRGDDGHSNAIQLLREAVDGFSGFSMVDEIRQAACWVEEKRYYKGLRALKPLLVQEAALLLQIPSRDSSLTKSQPKVA